MKVKLELEVDGFWNWKRTLESREKWKFENIRKIESAVYVITSLVILVRSWTISNKRTWFYVWNWIHVQLFYEQRQWAIVFDMYGHEDWGYKKTPVECRHLIELLTTWRWYPSGLLKNNKIAVYFFYRSRTPQISKSSFTPNLTYSLKRMIKLSLDGSRWINKFNDKAFDLKIIWSSKAISENQSDP